MNARLAGILAGLAVLVIATACGGDDDPALVTTTSRVVTTAAPTTEPDPTTTVTTTTITAAVDKPGSATESPSTTATEEEGGEISFRVARQESTRDGTVLHLEVPPGDYTDVDLENLVLSMYEERDDLYELHVFDSHEAISALLTPESERTPRTECPVGEPLPGQLPGGIHPPIPGPLRQPRGIHRRVLASRERRLPPR